ncbi:MAG TPA: UDP-N-acetylglucosamine--N-acetylmuramyl-(pentapeptide) pyrophosphoryl-undecaprenol N-acetylglucosamine transferase [Chlamydiales bacterium]|nr:UDP-N-acetylglucosamine--N-acetylmuramyl-(pentapeptide) pyrophosphoryl-undecaprenol N-acetylglucosamine transferase [Chlamydiales bacterium]
MKEQKFKILIAAGGSGGHLFPAQQMAMFFSDVVFAGHNLSKSPFFQKQFPHYDIAARAPNKLSFIFSTIKGLFQSLKLFSKYKIDIVVGFGSFHTFPVLLAATLLRKKMILFEANCALGKVNRLFSPFASKIAVQFPIPAKKTVFVPLLPWKARPKPVSKQDALSYFGLQQAFTILIFGGSQGATFFNEIMPKAIDAQVIHFTGKGHARYTNGCVKEFETRMDLAYTAADLVICRSGASTMAELICYGKPSLLIPFPYSSEDHQRENAKFFTEVVKGARMLDQKDATVAKIKEEIQLLRKDYSKYEKAIKEYDIGNRVEWIDLIK